MRQQVGWDWWGSRSGHRRLLVEDARAPLGSDFARFRQAGFEVAACTGPDASGPRCPLLDGRRCDLLDTADVVLCGLDPADASGRRIFEVSRLSHPDLPMVVERPDETRAAGPSTRGCVELRWPASVEGQINAVQRALYRRAPLTHAIHPPRNR